MTQAWPEAGNRRIRGGEILLMEVRPGRALCWILISHSQDAPSHRNCILQHREYGQYPRSTLSWQESLCGVSEDGGGAGNKHRAQVHRASSPTPAGRWEAPLRRPTRFVTSQFTAARPTKASARHLSAQLRGLPFSRCSSNLILQTRKPRPQHLSYLSKATLKIWPR